MLNSKLQQLISEQTLSGKLPAYAFPGGYPIFYLNNHNDVFCVDCANDHADFDEIIVDYDVNWEDASLYCDHCSRRIESAYAEDEITE